jgi:MSHA pilin protein MshC
MRPARVISHSAPPPAKEAGFTLVELAVVLAVLGLLAGIVGPRLFRAGEFKARLFADETRAAVRFAQRLAVASGCNVQVTFTASSYELHQQTGCSGASYVQAVTHPGTGATSYLGTAPPGATVSSSVNPLRFDALGRATNASGTVSSASITVADQTIAVIGETGFVH